MDDSKHRFEVAIVGAGMIGSSAAKYVAEDTKCILIGPPSEPQDGIYGAWFDEARIARKLDASPLWRDLAVKSIDRYRQIEVESGISFYSEVGYLTIRPPSEEYTNVIREHALQGINCQKVTECGPLQWPRDCEAFLQRKEAGYINPRAFVQAQQRIAQRNNCKILHGLVTRIQRNDNDNQGEFSITVQTASGKDVKTAVVVKAKKVIMAVGAYVNINSLIKGLLQQSRPGLEPDLHLTSQTIAYLEVAPNEAERLKNMPTVVTNYSLGLVDGTYILPPVLYPDGKYYLKLGHHDNFEATLKSPEDVRRWYQDGRGCLEAVNALAHFVTSHFIPSLKTVSVHGGCCVTAKTPFKRGPYIDEMGPGLYLAGGGCGYAAKSCDEIGRIAAKLCTMGKWTASHQVPQSECKIRWKPVDT